MKTNRDYFSYSQYKLWRTSRKEFWKRYGLGIPSPTNKYIELGKAFMRSLEFDEWDKQITPVVSLVEKYDFVELDFRSQLAVGDKNVELRGIFDSVSDDYVDILEYKTSKNEWTQSDVDTDEQTLFYAALVWLEYEIIPDVRLVWVETAEDDNGNLYFTGKVTSFDRKPITEAQIVTLLDDVAEAIREIEEYEYTEAYFSDDKWLELTQAKIDLDLAKDRYDAIISGIMLELAESRSKNAASEFGTLTLASRKSYKYSDKVKQLADELKTAKKEEEKSGVATATESSYVIFKPSKI